MNENIKFAFFGNGIVSKETLEILKQNNYLPSIIITSLDKPKGRKMILTPPNVKVWAIENKIPYIQIDKLDEDFIKKLETFNFDLFIVVAFGKIMPEKIINMPKFGSINIHYSLLPKYRGASPLESAILNGDKKTGVTIQKMEYKMDTGPIIAQEEIEIDGKEDISNLREELIKLGGELLIKKLPDFIENKIILIKQEDEKASYCKKIKKEDGLVDIENENPIILYNKYRAYRNWPRIYFFKDNKRIIITEANLKNNSFVIKKVIPEGGKEISFEEFRRNF